MSEPNHALWIYAICRGLDDSVLAEVRGVDEETPRQVRANDLTAVVGAVDAGRFGADELTRSLNDMNRLGVIARAHHSVVQATGTAGPIAPARLAILYDNDNGVREMLTTHCGALLDTLRHVDGCREWGVKVHAATSPEATGATEPAPATGTAYLAQRRAALSARESTRTQVRAGVDVLSERLGSVCVDARRHRPQDPQLSGDSRPMVLNDAFLVQVGDTDRFVRTVNDVAAAHPELAIELTGPWPPYSFAVIGEESS
jgi:hypothetical protein